MLRLIGAFTVLRHEDLTSILSMVMIPTASQRTENRTLKQLTVKDGGTWEGSFSIHYLSFVVHILVF